FLLDDLNVDFASFSGHKIGALKGVGCLYVADVKNFKPLLHGGGQERGYRPGTMNFSSYKTFLLALEDIHQTDLDSMLKLREEFEIKLKELGVKINCEKSPRLSNTISAILPNVNARVALAQLSRRGIFISTGSACASGSFDISHVLKSLNMNRDEAERCVRISFGPTTSSEDGEILLKALAEVIEQCAR